MNNTKPKTDFDVFNEMSENNMDIRMCPDITDVQMVKAGGKITFGVPRDTYDIISRQLMNGNQTHYAVMYIVNKEQYEKIKNAK